MTKKNQDSEDGDLFRLTIGIVRSIKNDKVQLSGADKPKPYPKSKPAEIENRFVERNDYDLETVSIEDQMNYIAPGLQKNVLVKMRKGHFGLDAEIDLHGLTSEEAKRQLLFFLHRAVKDGYRCVLIVHGKGYRSRDNLPVLKNNLNLWLRQHQDVLAFCSAKPKEGGTGAVLILLKLAEKYANKDYIE